MEPGFTVTEAALAGAVCPEKRPRSIAGAVVSFSGWKVSGTRRPATGSWANARSGAEIPIRTEEIRETALGAAGLDPPVFRLRPLPAKKNIPKTTGDPHCMGAAEKRVEIKVGDA